MPKSWLVRGAEAADRARRRMIMTGFTPNGHPIWQRVEVEPVVGLYPDYPSIFQEVERRTHSAIYSKAVRLGITKKRALPWSDNEILLLRKVYPTGTRDEVLASFRGRTYAAVAKAANARGIFRQKKPEPPTGSSLLDQILVRAARFGYSMGELDALARTRSYFRKRSWKKKLNEAVHCRAAKALGGTLRARFP